MSYQEGNQTARRWPPNCSYEPDLSRRLSSGRPFRSRTRIVAGMSRPTSNAPNRGGCPKWGGQLLRRSPRRADERLLARRRPYRCESCGRRVWLLPAEVSRLRGKSETI